MASTLTTMAVLLPVLLLAGLAQKLFAPLALTVAVAMIASYFVSICVTPVACRYFLGHTSHGRFGSRVEAFIDGVADRYADTLRRVLPFRRTIVGASVVLVVGSAWAATRLPSTFFPEIDESMERIYVRLAPGTSLQESSKLINRMGATLERELGKGLVQGDRQARSRFRGSGDRYEKPETVAAQQAPLRRRGHPKRKVNGGHAGCEAMLQGLTQELELPGRLVFDQVGDLSMHRLGRRDWDPASSRFANEVMRRPQQSGHVDDEASPDELTVRL